MVGDAMHRVSTKPITWHAIAQYPARHTGAWEGSLVYQGKTRERAAIYTITF